MCGQGPRSPHKGTLVPLTPADIPHPDFDEVAGEAWLALLPQKFNPTTHKQVYSWRLDPRELGATRAPAPDARQHWRSRLPAPYAGRGGTLVEGTGEGRPERGEVDDTWGQWRWVSGRARLHRGTRKSRAHKQERPRMERGNQEHSS